MPVKGNIAVLTQMMNGSAAAKAPATPQKAPPAAAVATPAPSSPAKKVAAAAAADDIPAAVRRLTDQELRTKYNELGAVCPPVTAATRPLIERRYVKLLLGRDDLDHSPAKPATDAEVADSTADDEDDEQADAGAKASVRHGLRGFRSC